MLELFHNFFKLLNIGLQILKTWKWKSKIIIIIKYNIDEWDVNLFVPMSSDTWFLKTFRRMYIKIHRS